MIKMPMKLFIAVCVIAAAAGCKPKFIPNTEVPDTEENRDIVSFCERYRHAVEDLNVGLLLSLASPKYFDDSGTVSGDDDMDRAGLEAVLKNRFKTIEAVRYEIRYRAVYTRNNIIMVEYAYTTSYRFNLDGEAHWENKTADNRLELEKVDDGYRILSGM